MAKNIISGKKITSKRFVSIGSKGDKLYNKGITVKEERIIEDVPVKTSIDNNMEKLKEAIREFGSQDPLKDDVVKKVVEQVVPQIILNPSGISGRDRFVCGICGRKDFKTKGGAELHLKKCKRSL